VNLDLTFLQVLKRIRKQLSKRIKAIAKEEQKQEEESKREINRVEAAHFSLGGSSFTITNVSTQDILKISGSRNTQNISSKTASHM